MEKLTPMMAQYKKIKAEYPDAILMFRLGDFYEMFFEDALTASKILQITLTARNKGSEEKAPMCGIPYHAVDNYLVKLTRAGKKVAICDQVTEPDGKGIVEREVVRVVTPGTTFDDNILERNANNFVAALVEKGGACALAFCDVTTGEFRVTELKNAGELDDELARVSPAELIMEEVRALNGKIYTFPFSYFGEAREDLLRTFGLHSLKAFGIEEKSLAIEASAMLLAYIKETQKTDPKHIQKIQYYSRASFMSLDYTCIRNLELFGNSNDGKREGSLIEAIDQTVCSMGGRLLRSYLLHPLIDKGEIEARQERVERFFKDSSLLRRARENLEKIYDLERLISRLSLGSGNARDLTAVKKTLAVVPDLLDLLGDGISDQKDLFELLDQAVDEGAPTTVREGGMIRDGFNDELDELRQLSREGKGFIKKLEEREITRTGINSLKVRFNRVFGYYIEISKANLKMVPEDYIRKQTLVNAERFITPELKDYEEKVLNAEQRIKELEFELFYELRMNLVAKIVELQKLARALAELDVYSSLAYLAIKWNYCRPAMGDGGEFRVVAGRHPVIEQISSAGAFVANDILMDADKNFLLITGPNMGGKSTYLRQTALITLLAQIGSYVPATEAILTVVDRIFTRVGASDNLSRGESTFMVEMQEAAYILNNATERSLIILDEIGRGTSTYDGVSIAWAIMEYIHDKIGAKTIFATHYHELINLADKLPRAVNLSVGVRENEREGVVFLYKVLAGAVDKSYGIEVAKLAGLPLEVIGRSRGVLVEMEKNQLQNKQQMAMFERRHSGIELEKIKKAEKILEKIANLKPEEMTPLSALQQLDELKKEI